MFFFYLGSYLNVVFFLYMDYDLLILSFDYILVFDVLLMDINNYYNKFIGIFIVLYLGIYVFIWIFYCVVGGFIYF